MWQKRSWRRSSLSTHTGTLCSPPASKFAPPLPAATPVHVSEPRLVAPLPHHLHLPPRITEMGCSFPQDRCLQDRTVHKIDQGNYSHSSNKDLRELKAAAASAPKSPPSRCRSVPLSVSRHAMGAGQTRNQKN